eukprot:jgi/Psemu1/200153/e_gw1.252.20.1
MKQHNASTSDGRNCWGSARERQRMKARFNIRQRVNHSAAAYAFVPDDDDDDDEMISRYLSYIRKGDRSKFSTTFMDRHFAVISARHSIRKHVLGDPHARSETLGVATKLSGSDYADELLHHMESVVETFTFMEYAVWMGKYSVVSGMLHGGVNPCVRGTTVTDALPPSALSSKDVEEHQLLLLQQRHRLARIGTRVLKRFFDSFPLRLSTYIVKRVVQMRIVETLYEDQQAGTFHCPICSSQVPTELRLRLESRHDTSYNEHMLCESCFWNNLLSHIDSPATREARDVVASCLSCPQTDNCDDRFPRSNNSSSTGTAASKTRFLHDDISYLSPAEKCELSLERFHRLPANQRELKRLSSRKKKISEGDHLASNWLDAVFPSLGSTQDVRRDKFLVHVERNAIPYVRGCLLAGVDVHQVNEYGQSAVYVAAWRGYDALVKLLLEFGADANLPANGGSTIRSLCSGNPRPCQRRVRELTDSRNASWSSETTVTSILTTNSDETSNADSSPTQCWLRMQNNEPTPSILDDTLVRNDLCYRTLIPASSDHPGAGSCVIDEAISPGAVDALLELFRSLPVDRNQKPKKNSLPCSDRSYFCDTEGVLRRLLGAIVVRAGVAATAEPIEAIRDDNDNDPPSAPRLSSSPVVRVFPHMRFLHYSRAGAVLAPHIDLCRVNPFYHQSGQQHPRNYRSTHTFILYLTECSAGGETRLLEEVTADGSSPALATVSPRRGRLLVFPHVTPHEGREVIDVPKILLRGELQITNERMNE